MEHLEGHSPVVLKVLGHVDRGHSATPDLALDLVAAGKGGREAGKRVSQRACPGSLQDTWLKPRLG
jgi:hypothetical protein